MLGEFNKLDNEILTQNELNLLHNYCQDFIKKYERMGIELKINRNLLII